MEHLRATMESLQRNEVNGERIQAEGAAAAREAGIPRDVFENLARGVVTENSKMHDEMMRQHRQAAEASASHATLQTERLLQGHTATLQELQRSHDAQKKVAESLKNMPDAMVREVMRQMNVEPPQPPPADPPPDAAQTRLPVLVKELTDVMKEAGRGNDVQLTQVLQQIAAQLQQFPVTPMLNIDNRQLADMIMTLIADTENASPML